MGSVFLARMAGSAGFTRLVAIKRLRPELAAEPDFITMLVDEAHLASQIRHVNVVDTLDLVASDGAFNLVLEYIEGAALSWLITRARRLHEPIPRPMALTLIGGVLRGLDAAHEARSSDGHLLGIVHRDVSPQNVLVGVDGIPRIIDFGIAKALGKMSSTRPGEIRGKFAYMAPEQLLGRPVTRQADVYAAGVLLWELLTGRRLFEVDDERALMACALAGTIEAPSTVDPTIPSELDRIVLKATARELSDRYLTARELLDALAPWHGASAEEVGAWVRRLAAEPLAKTHALLQSVAPEVSRSIDELLAELSASAGSISGHGAAAAGPPRASWAPAPAGPEVRTESSYAITSRGVELDDRGPAGHDSRVARWFLAVAGTLATVGLILGALGLRGGHLRADGARVDALAETPSVSILASPPPPPPLPPPPSLPPSELSVPPPPVAPIASVASVASDAPASAPPRVQPSRPALPLKASPSAHRPPPRVKRPAETDKDFDHR